MGQVDLYNEPKPYFVKSPFNYTGGKYKLLKQIIPHFPKNINTIIDVFGGGFNVGLNINSNKIVYNEHIKPLTILMEYLYTHKTSETINYIERTIIEKELSKTNKDTFNKFREEYNNNPQPNPLDFYILISYSFNYQIRFNNQMKYNSSHGTNRSSFTKTMKNNLIRFMERLHERNITFTSNDFREINYIGYNRNDFFYFDPPYFITSSSYNDGTRGFGDWTMNEEYDLYQILDDLDDCGYSWGLSNSLIHDGRNNIVLREWLEDNHEYNVYMINSDYTNSSYQKKNRDNNKNIEVYITNMRGDML